MTSAQTNYYYMKKFGPALSFIALVSICISAPLHSATAEIGLSADEARQIALLPPKGKDAADLEIVHWQARLAEKPSYSPYWERLGWAYIAKARLTQDAGYYKLAQLTISAWVAQCGPSLEAKLLEGHVDHNLHQFKTAETIARSLIAQRQNPADYALLSDALMEQGTLDEAVRACQTLSNLRPGVEAFTRIAHLRLLYGDLDGAIQAMDAAIRAGDPRDYESRAWMYSRLAGYQLLKNDASMALAFANKALDGAPDHPLALAIKGRALYSIGKYDEALAALKRAAEFNP
ncbi:MAG TPA: CDC27 family protein, partial [Opitutaceae bacterium]